MTKVSRSANGQPKPRRAQASKGRPRPDVAKASARTGADPQRAGWATDLVFDVREPKLAVSLRLDADVLRFFRGFGAGYQTRINEVLKAFMQARAGTGSIGHAAAGARASRAASSDKRAAR